MRWSVSTPRLKHILLVGQSLVFLIAFASVYRQIPGLYGEDGITPAAAKIEKCNAKDPFSCTSPGIFLITQYANVKPSTAMQLAALFGILLSILTIAFTSLRNFISYLLLTLTYLSLFQVGGTFLWFQWDTLLLESGYLMAVLASFWDSPADVMSTYLIRFLAARLMFASGVVKLQSMCPTWWGLTALDHHFESQCLPTPLSWIAHNHPEWIRHLGVAVMFFIEVYLPPLFLVPIPALRILAGIPQILLMVLIMATGNYNFFNIHYAVLAYSCFEGRYNAREQVSKQRKFLEFIVSFAIFGFAAYHWAVMFGIKFDQKTMSVASKIMFTEKEFAQMVKIGTSVVVHLGVIGFVLSVLSFLRIVWNERSVVATPVSNKKKNKKGEKEAAKPVVSPKKGVNFRHALFVLFFGNFLFWISFIPFTNIDDTASNRIPFALRALHKDTSKFEFTHSYGLFRRMTGVEGRPEIIVEGASDLAGPWKEIPFYAKPGDVSVQPPFVLPHQPRLDWQMWFAALGAYQHNPWFMSFVNRLLHNETEVIGLLRNWPFTDTKNPLRFVRAQLYHYHFTKAGEKNVWKRDLQHEYMPTMTKDAPALLEFLAQNSLLTTGVYKEGEVDRVVDKIFKEASKIDQTVFVWSIFGSALFICFLNRLFRK